MYYLKPFLSSYGKEWLFEVLGPMQMQYTTAILNPTATPNNEINRGDLDGSIDRPYLGSEKYGDDSINTSGEVQGQGYGLVSGGRCLQSDSTIYGNEWRIFVGFDISEIQSTVVSATLKIYQHGFLAGYGDPYSEFGNLIVEHINFGSELDTSDFDTTALATITSISDSSNGWKTTDVTQYVQDDINSGRTYSQYRLRFTETYFNMSAGEQSYAGFSDSDDSYGDGNKPVLEVTYY